MSARAEALARGRVFAEEGMADTCTIRRVTGSSTDQSTGVRTPDIVTLYTGKCRVQQSLAQAAQHEAAGDYVLLLRLEVQLPMVGSEGLEVNDEITIGTSTKDADLSGRVFLIRDLFHKTDATARRVGVMERTAS